LTESELVRKERFERLYAECASAVLAYALRRASPEEAADAAAETFAVAWRRLDELPAGWELAWLYGVARRVLATQRRAIGRQRTVAIRLAGEERAVAGTGIDEVEEPVLEALAELDERDREVLMLTAWEGLSGREGAAALGCSDTAYRIRLHRARKRLRARLAALESPEARARPLAPRKSEETLSW
jgi:RNA polymerase sigma-70 factor, ECF subfamily